MIRKGFGILILILCFGLILTGCPKKTMVKEEPSLKKEEAARLEADRAYWERKSGKRSADKSGGITANIEMAKVELPPPPKARGRKRSRKEINHESLHGH